MRVRLGLFANTKSRQSKARRVLDMMNTNRLALLSRPLLSRVEHVEQVRQLRIGQRLQYILLSALALSVAFVVIALLAVALATVLFSLYLGGLPGFGDMIVFSLPIVGAFMVSLGFSGSPVPERAVPGQTLRDAVYRAARGGLIYGVLASLLTGIVWFFVIHLEQLYIHLVTIYSGYVSLERVSVQIVIIMIVTGPALAVFRGFACLNGYFILYRLREGVREVPADEAV